MEQYAVDEFLPRVEAVRRPGTYETYVRALKTYLLDAKVGRATLGSLRLEQVHTADLERTLRGLLRPRGERVAGKLAPRTVLLLVGILAALFREAKRDGLLLDNPAHDLTDRLGLSARIAEERDEETHALTEEQQTRLKDALKTWSSFLARFVTFGLHTGCRIGEILGLRWQDVDEHARELHVGWTLSAVTERRKTVRQRLGRTKSGKARRVHVNRTARAVEGDAGAGGGRRAPCRAAVRHGRRRLRE